MLEAGPDVGHAWRSRWDSLRLFTPAQYDALPGMPFPAPAGTYPTKDQVADYLQAYATTFGLPIQLNSSVSRLQRNGDLFELTTAAGERMLTRQVVVTPCGAGRAPVLWRGTDPAAGGAVSSGVRLLVMSLLRTALGADGVTREQTAPDLPGSRR